MQAQPPKAAELAPSELPEASGTTEAGAESEAKLQESSKVGGDTKQFPTHGWFRSSGLKAPGRDKVLTFGQEISVTGSTALECRTRLFEDFLGVACSPDLTPRDLAVIRGQTSETWVEGSELGFVAHLPPGGVVTAALGWDETSRVIRVVRKSDGFAEGKISSAEALIVMASDEEHPHAHFYGYELDHEIDYWVRIQRPGCEPRVLSGSVVGGYDDPLGNAESRDIGEVDQYGRPEGPIRFDPTYDRAYAQLQEWYEEQPAGLGEECHAVRKPPLRGRLWPLRPGDAPELQSVGREKEPSDREFASAHPRAPIVGGAHENGCEVRRVRSFVEIECSPASSFGNALGHWTFAGEVLKASLDGGRIKLRFKATEERQVDSTLVWERGALEFTFFASKVSSYAGGVEVLKEKFYRGDRDGREVVMRLRTDYSPEYKALDYPLEVRSNFSRPEGGRAAFEVWAEGVCPRKLDGSGEWGLFSQSEEAERTPKIPGAAPNARYYFDDNSTVAVDPGGAVVWFSEPAELRRYGLNEENRKLSEECRLKNFGPLKAVSVQSLVSAAAGN